MTRAIPLALERTEKLPMGSIKNVVSEPIEGHEDYHMMVSAERGLAVPGRGLDAPCPHPRRARSGASPGLASPPSRSVRAGRPPLPSPL